MAPKSVLVTGANGHLGFRNVVSALQAGYKVRAVVRREAAAAQIKSVKSVQAFRENIEVVVIEDLLKEDAYDDAVVGMDAIIHVASPIVNPNSRDFLEEIIQPAVQMTLGLLKSAASTSSSVKRVVITSSVAVLDFASGKVLEATDIAPVPSPYENFATPMEAYRASKCLARAESLDFVSKNKPGFDIINVLPSVILGRSELVTSTESYTSAGTNRYIVGIITGSEKPARTIAGSVHVNDCAEIHVRALDPNIEGNQDFLAHANPVDWRHGVSAIVRKNFPQEVGNGVFKMGGVVDGTEMVFDSSETEEVFGIEWIGLEEQVKSVVGHYLESFEGRK